MPLDPTFWFGLAAFFASVGMGVLAGMSVAPPPPAELIPLTDLRDEYPRDLDADLAEISRAAG